jgi:hypothetical protein
VAAAFGSPLLWCEGIYTDAGTKLVDSNGTFFSFSNPSVNDSAQFKQQVYADGFAPSIQRFDKFKATTIVGMARASECQVP